MNKVLIIAEVGSVHDGSFGNALKLAELAQSLGADAVKFQTHIADQETLPDAPSPGYFSAENRFDYFTRTGFSLEQWKQLKAHCDELGIEFISSPFSELAVQWLDEIGVSRFKIPSGEVTNLPMLEAINQIGRPVLLSSGMSNWQELDAAVEMLSDVDLMLMQCTSMYPCANQKVGLNVISEMSERYGKDVGFSDHTQQNYAAFAAVTMGAVCVEKHLTFSNAMYGSDAPLAAEPHIFADMVQGVRAITEMQESDIDKDDLSDFKDMKQIFEKSIVAAKDIKKGEKIAADMLAYKKPGDGISAADYRTVVGKTALSDIAADAMIQQSDIK